MKQRCGASADATGVEARGGLLAVPKGEERIRSGRTGRGPQRGTRAGDPGRGSQSLHAGEALILEMVASGAALGDILDAVALFAEKQMRGARCLILLADESAAHLQLASAPSLPASAAELIARQEIGPDGTPCGVAAFTRQRVIVTDFHAAPWNRVEAVAAALAIASCWATPIIVGDRTVLGTIALLYRRPHRPSVREFRVIDRTSSLAGLAIDRARVHQALVERESMFRSLSRCWPVGIFVTDRDGRAIYANPRCRQIFGEGRDLVGDWRATSVHLEDRDSLLRKWKAAARNAESFSDEFRLSLSTRLVWVHARSAPLLSESGELVGHIGTVEDITDRKRTEESIRQLSARLLHAQDEERRRIARELHDSTAQNLTALAMTLEQAAAAQARNHHLRRVLDNSVQIVRETLREVRTLSYLLHPPMLEELGLEHALRWLTEGFTERSGIRVSLHLAEGLGRWPEEYEIAAFRIVQEGLTNVYRHSGSATARVAVALSDSRAIVEIADEGRGIPAEILSDEEPPVAAPGVGIAGMRERARQLGGSLIIESGGRGTTVRAMLPRPTGTDEAAPPGVPGAAAAPGGPPGGRTVAAPPAGKARR